MSDRTVLSSRGMRLLWARALSRDIELRLAVAWPPTTNPQMPADRFPEPDGGGYAREMVPGTSWNFADDLAEAMPRTFRFSSPPAGAPSIVGQVLVDKETGTLLYAERFAEGPVPFPPTGELILTVTPTIRWREGAG